MISLRKSLRSKDVYKRQVKGSDVMAERIITYPLHVNAMQYRYICHEVQRTRQVYLYFRNMILKNYEKVKQHQCQQLLDVYKRQPIN